MVGGHVGFASVSILADKFFSIQPFQLLYLYSLNILV